MKTEKVKITNFGSEAFSYSAFQPPFDIKCLWSLGFIGKLAFGSPLGNSRFVRSHHMAPRNIKLAQTLPSQGTNSHIGRVESLIFIFVPREIHVRPV